MELKRVHDEVATLAAVIEAAIEEALKNGQKSIDDLNDNHVNAGSGVVGWVDDF
jgi:flavin-binding protein dodecin